MATPVRIQRSRAKGWRMPENTVSVARPGPWGNPFVIGEPSGVFRRERGIAKAETLIAQLTVMQCVVFFGEIARGMLCPEHYPLGHQWVAALKARYNGAHPSDIIRAELRGKNLACWCRLCPTHTAGKPLGAECPDCAPCHSDILLRIANG